MADVGKKKPVLAGDVPENISSLNSLQPFSNFSTGKLVRYLYPAHTNAW